MSYQQIIYNRLRKHGITVAGALGVLGNFDCESNCEPFRMQGDFSPYRTNSHVYVQTVTNGTKSKDTFSRDGVGFGIYQLTYWTRKAGYYDFWKASGKNLDDAALQVDYAVKEMEEDYPQLLAFLKSTGDIFTATSRVCREFERPAVNNIDARYAAAKRIQYEIDLDGGGEDPDPEPVPATHELVLRTIDKNCEDFLEYTLMEILLGMRNYMIADVDNIVSTDSVWNALKQFQKDSGLEPDGVCGKMTWNALLKR